jgi:CRISPR-associated protein Csm1
MTFEGIAEHASGQKLLGFVKADVDNLGLTFIFGLKQDGGSYDTMSRLATLSRSLDLFFTGWIEHLVSTEFKHCYTVYSGGDDLFYVGPWDEILALIERINNDFRKFTCDQRLSLSAGVFIGKPGYPIARAADEAADSLKAAKSAAGKNSISVLGHTVSWNEWADTKKEWQRLLEIDSVEGGLTSALLYNLLEFAAMWRSYQNGNTLGLRFHPLLTYQVKRNFNPRTNTKLIEWIQPLLKWPLDDGAKKLLGSLGLIMQLCLFSKRGGRE